MQRGDTTYGGEVVTRFDGEVLVFASSTQSQPW
jgi:hypothetical protein